VWTGFNYLRIRSNGRLLWSQYWTFMFHEEWGTFDKLSKFRLHKKYHAQYSVKYSTGLFIIIWRNYSPTMCSLYNPDVSSMSNATALSPHLLRVSYT
jgi:hypothetical protein